ncbi:hypothetical protein H5A45_01015 [Pectobacterium polaris]|nr:hypothetical protein [Pectobacterium polaris]
MIEGVIVDKDFIKKVWSDNNYIDHDTAIRNFIQDYISTNNITGEFDKFTIERLASAVVEKVLKDLFMRDVKMMANNAIWKQFVGESDSTIIIKNGKSKEILNRYIRIGSQRRRSGGDKVMIYLVVDYTLSGIKLKQAVPLEVQHEPVLLPILNMKAKIAVLRSAA